MKFSAASACPEVPAAGLLSRQSPITVIGDRGIINCSAEKMTIALQSIEPRLPVTDLKASIDFYQELLAFNADDTVFVHDGFALLRKEKIGIQLVTQSDAHPLSPNTVWIDYVGVPSLHEQIKDRFIIEWGPEVYSYGRREFAVIDPDGHRIIFSEPSAESPSCAESKEAEHVVGGNGG